MPVGGEVPGADTEVLGLTVGVGAGAVAGVVEGEGEGRAVGFGVLLGVGVGVGVVDDPEAGRSPDELLTSVDGGLTLA